MRLFALRGEADSDNFKVKFEDAYDNDNNDSTENDRDMKAVTKSDSNTNKCGSPISYRGKPARSHFSYSSLYQYRDLRQLRTRL